MRKARRMPTRGDPVLQKDMLLHLLPIPQAWRVIRHLHGKTALWVGTNPLFWSNVNDPFWFNSPLPPGARSQRDGAG